MSSSRLEFVSFNFCLKEEFLKVWMPSMAACESVKIFTVRFIGTTRIAVQIANNSARVDDGQCMVAAEYWVGGSTMIHPAPNMVALFEVCTVGSIDPSV